jgi:ABC-type lipoprotein release transport system permease subunit
MRMVAAMSFRNLLRQKRRNMLLGIAIAFGAMVLILANAFSHGISKVMFERIVRYAVGHVSVSYMRSGDMMNMVFHDDERILEAIKKAAPEAARTEEGAGFWGRAIGKGMADNVMLVGIDMRAKITEKEQKEYESNFKMIHGSFNALRDNSRGIPVLLSEQKAKYLKVKTGDIVRVRFTGIYNQTTSAQLLVVGIFKPANVFMAIPVFLELQDLRRLGGYGPHDIAAMQVTLNDPQRTAKKVADRIHDELTPGLAVMEGAVAGVPAVACAHCWPPALSLRKETAQRVSVTGVWCWPDGLPER